MRTNLTKGVRLTLLLLLLCLLFTACHPALPDPMSLRTHTDLQATYLAGRYELVGNYAKGTAELSRPIPATVDLSDESADFISVEYGKSPSFEEPFTLPVADGKAEIYNLETDVIYYYRGVTESGEKGETHALRVENVLPRNLYIDGVTNARDLGGYQTSTGKVRQGMLYRTAKLNKNKADAPTLFITPEGMDTMLSVLKVRTEVDLRKTEDNEIGSLTGSVLGDSVKYVNCPMSYGTDMPVANDESLRRLFTLLAEEDSYPLFFHCSIGTDRTGYCAFLMLTLLGVDNEDIYRDYLFSNFGNIGGNRTVENVLGFSFFLALYEGDTFQEKAENYLLSLGVTRARIDSFRSIMIEG